MRNLINELCGSVTRSLRFMNDSFTFGEQIIGLSVLGFIASQVSPESLMSEDRAFQLYRASLLLGWTGTVLNTIEHVCPQLYRTGELIWHNGAEMHLQNMEEGQMPRARQ